MQYCIIMATFIAREDIMTLKEGGRRLAIILETVAQRVCAGASTKELDKLAESLIRKGGDTPSFLHYQPLGADFPFPASLCTSVNDEVVHGIPGNRLLRDGDIIGLDLGLVHDGLFTDMAMTVPVGKIDRKVARLLSDTENALLQGVAVAKSGNRISDISRAIEVCGRMGNYGIVCELGGHGVGRAAHEEPHIPNYWKKGDNEDALLRNGMVLALEPMFNLGSRHILQKPDGYTIITKDGNYSAHFEHTILVTDSGGIIITSST
jgi:methionyl aminopeptidase